MFRNIKQILFISLIVVLSVTNLYSLAKAQDSKKPKVVFTNDEVSITSKNNSQPKDHTNPIELDLEFKELDLELAIASDPNNEALLKQQQEVNKELTQLKQLQHTTEIAIDLSYRKRYVSLKIILITLERNLQKATTDFQNSELNKTNPNTNSKVVEDMRSKIESINRQIKKVEFEINDLVKEGNRLGVSARAFKS